MSEEIYQLLSKLEQIYNREIDITKIDTKEIGTLIGYVMKIDNQLQQKENIIKEVREYNQKVYDTTEGNEKILAQTNLKILDKEGNNGNNDN